MAPERRSRADKQAETRQRLIDGAAKVFRERGFQGASVDAITREAGYSRGAFYSNFESKEQLFVELLQNRVYREYERMMQESPHVPGTPLDALKHAAKQLADRNRDDNARWLFELWLELLAHAARDREFAGLAAGFWSGNRQLLAQLTVDSMAKVGREPPVDPMHLATAQIAMDIGLAIQHLVDPEAVPLTLYESLWELLFAPFVVPPDAPDETRPPE